MSAETGGGTPGSGAMSDRMRALLSRAAEEQLLEQRQVSTVLGELRALVEDVDERLATGEQVDRAAAEVQALSARVEARLDAAEARSTELADRITDAIGQAAQDLVETVAAAVTERVERQLRDLTAAVAASAEDLVQGAERRLATHVDDAVLALAEVVLRRARPHASAVSGPQRPVAAATGGQGESEVPAGPTRENPSPVEDVTATGPPADHSTSDAAPEAVEPEPDEQALTEPAPRDAPGTESPYAADAFPGDGFVLVPADVEEPDAGPAPPAQEERRTADRRTADRGDGSGRRRRPWWRPV